MRIVSVDLEQISMKLKKPFKTALRQLSVAEAVIVKITTDTGDIGYGSASPTAVITGDINESIRGVINNYIAPAIIGMDIEELEPIMKKIQAAAVHNPSAKAAVDIAIYDIFGKRYNIPLYKLFGGSGNVIESDITISLNSPGEMASDAVSYVDKGYTTLKIKVGLDGRLDIKRIKAIRDAIGNSVKLRLDANQGWSPKEAITTIRYMEDSGLNLELIEQPVKARDIDGLKQVTQNVATPIMADESLFSPYDCFMLLKNRAVDILNIKLMKCGGFHNALKINAIAESCGIECMVGCMIESKIGVVAAAHLAGGKINITGADLDAIDLIADEPIYGGVELSGNKLILSDKAGLGIDEIILE